jgi:hypothetical protein
MTKTKKTSDEITAIVGKYRNGATLRSLSKEFGISLHTVRKYLSNAGIHNSPGATSYRHSDRPPLKTIDLTPAYDYIQNLGDPSKTRVIHDLVEANGVGYKWSSRHMLRRRIAEYLDTPPGRFSQVARLMAIHLSGGNEPEQAAIENARNQLHKWLYNYTEVLPFVIESAAIALGIDGDIMAIKKWLVKKEA